MSIDHVLEDLYDGLDGLLFAGHPGPEGHAEAMLAAAQLGAEGFMDPDPLGLLDDEPDPTPDPAAAWTPGLVSATPADWAEEAETSVGDKVLKAAWIATHVDNMLGALAEGSISGLLGEHKVVDKLHEVWQTGATADWTVTCLPPDRPYVVFSDHHFLWADAQHDYFTHWNNRAMYEHLLGWYGGMGFTLVDAGDVEDLIVKPPGWGALIEDQFFDLLGLLTGGWLKRRHLIKEREQRYRGILANYAGVHSKIGAWFHRHGRFVKLAGNHDTDLRDPAIQPLFQGAYGPPAAGMTELLFISHVDWQGLPTGDFRAFVAHGHQLDAWTNDSAGPGCGEAFTESLGWFGGGADRVWTEPQWRAQTEDLGGWENFLVRAPSMAPGDHAKIRHMGELPIYKAMSDHFAGVPAQQQPYLVLGHTHEPRQAPWISTDADGATWDRYLNTGSAGRYQDLIWCVEIHPGGQAVLVAWTFGAGGFPMRHTMVPVPGQPLMRMAPAP